MNYNILGVHIQQLTGMSQKAYKVFVAWQSNLPDMPFLWRCTTNIFPNFPDYENILMSARKGEDELDQKLVKRLFPYLPKDALSH